MAVQLKAFKFRLYPTPDQEVLLNKTFGCTRFVWNALTANFNEWSPDHTPDQLSSKILKDDPDNDFLNEVSAATLQQKERDFIELKKQFFNKKRKKRLGRPQFKKKGVSKDSFRLPNQKFSLNSETGTIKLEKIGHIKVIIDREIPPDANFRSVTVSKTPTGKFYASILVQINVEPKPLTGKKVGIDLGLNDLFITSSGEKTNNPRWFRENQAKLKKAQQHLSRKMKDSNRRNEQRIKVAKIHESIVNQRKDFLHKMTTELVTDYDVICVEDLNVSGMLKNHCVSKSIQDASWATFVSFLEYKCGWYGKTLVKIDRFYPSSKTCSNCGFKVDKESMNLDVRDWECPSCGVHHDRDINAAVNVLNKGFADLCGTELEFPGVSKKPGSDESFELQTWRGRKSSAIEPDLDEVSRRIIGFTELYGFS